MKVVDASAMIEVLVGSERSNSLLAALDDDVFAPDLLVAEVFSSLRRMASSHKLTNADQLATSLRNAPVEYLHTWPYAERIWGWRHNMSPHDACYVALAEDLGATLVTTDLRLAKAAKGIIPVMSF
jgi:predicted nucleic acid-binding protein